MATKQVYLQRLEAQLKDWDARLSVLSAKAQRVKADARIGYENEVETLRRNRAAARAMLEDLGKRGEDAWEDMKDGVETARDEMRRGLEKLAARFK